MLLENLKRSLRFHETLNPKIWKNAEQILGDVQLKMYQNAAAFLKFMKIPKDKVKDIVFIGGNCNFNYTPQSDIDIHIVLKDDAYTKDEAEFLERFTGLAKNAWKQDHDIFIAGYNVEMYVEYPEQKRYPGQGIYSLEKNKWVQKPKPVYPPPDEVNIMRKARKYEDEIVDLLKKPELKAVESMINRLKQLRQSGLEEAGEFSTPNLVFKVLRDNGLIDKLWEIKKKLVSKNLSL